MVVFGGRSAEHDVSRATAVAVARALDPDALRGRPGRRSPARAAGCSPTRARELIANNPAALPSALEGRRHRSSRRSGAWWRRPGSGGLDVDVVFPLLHGPYGEDGTVQGLLDLADLPYVGSGVLGSAVGMDKVMMKRAFAACGLPQADYLALRDGEDRAAFARPGRRRARAAVLREAGEHGLVGRREQGARPRRARRGDRARRSTSTSGSSPRRRSKGARSRSRCSATRRPRRRCRARSCPGAEFYTYEDKYEDGAAELLDPRAARRRADRRGARARGARVRGVPLRRDGAGGLLLRGAGPRVPRERGQHDSRVHADLDVPEALGRVRASPYPELLERLIDLAIERHARRARSAPGVDPADRPVVLEADDGAGERAGDALDRLDLGDDHACRGRRCVSASVIDDRRRRDR